MLHHAGLGISALEINPQLPHEERADKPMAVPYGRADLTALIGKDDFAVVGLVDKPLRFEGSNRLVHRCFGNVEALGNVNGPHAVFGSLFLLDANQAFQIILVRHRQVQLARALGGIHILLPSCCVTGDSTPTRSVRAPAVAA